MAAELEEEKKKEGQPPPPAAVVDLGLDDLNLGDSTVEAENLIRAVLLDHVERFQAAMGGVVDDLEASLVGRPGEAQATFNDPGFMDALGGRLLAQLHALAGGPAPLMDALAAEAANTLAWAANAEPEIGGFLYHMRRGLRDACWLVRDGHRAILSDQWAQLTQLGAEGSFDFVPALIQLGLPPLDFDSRAFSDDLLGFTRTWERSHSVAREQLAEESPKAPEKQEEAARQQELLTEDPARKQAAAGA